MEADIRAKLKIADGHVQVPEYLDFSILVRQEMASGKSSSKRTLLSSRSIIIEKSILKRRSTYAFYVVLER